MKRAVLGITAVLTALNLFGQGTIIFTSHTTTPTARDSHIWSPSRTDPFLSLQGPASNDTPPGTTPYAANGMSLIGASGSGGHYGYATTFAELLAALGPSQPESSLVPTLPVTTFRSGSAAGQIVPVTVTLSGVPPGSILTLEAVAWDNSSGLYPTWAQAEPAWIAGLIAASPSLPRNFDLSLGNTFVHESFNLYMIPEPSAFGLAGLGAVALMVRRRRK